MLVCLLHHTVGPSRQLFWPLSLPAGHWQNPFVCHAREDAL